MKIGAQFYTIRESCKDLNRFAESLARVAEIGYRTVQISGVCPYEPQWLAEQLKKNDLQCVVTHIAKDRLVEDAEAVAKEHSVFGCDRIGLGYYHFDGENLESILADYVAQIKPVAETIAKNGKYFMYHNHDREFQKVNGKLILDHIAEVFAPEELGFILDTFWVQAGGADPADWLEKLRGRVPVIHLKDFAYGKKMAVIGEGNLNFDRIFAAAEKAGTQYMMVEQDDCYGEDPFDCLKRSYAYLAAHGFG